MPPRRPDALDPCGTVVAHFDSGCGLLLSDTRWRWLAEHWQRAQATVRVNNRPLSQDALARAALGMDPAYFGRLLNRKHGKKGGVKRATHEDYRRVRHGLRTLGVPVEPLLEPGQLPCGTQNPDLEDRCYQVAGYLVALNGQREGARECWPVGPLHYFCLELICVDVQRRTSDLQAGWFAALASREPARLREAAENIYDSAVHQVGRLAPHVLEDFADVDRRNPLTRTAAALQELSRHWMKAFQKVHRCLSAERTIAQDATRPPRKRK